MKAVLEWLTSPGWEQVVKALLHSLWQAGALAVFLALTFRRCASPAWRYRCALGSLATILFSTLITWAVSNQGWNNSANISPIPTSLAVTGGNKEHSPRAGESIILITEPRRQTASAEAANWAAWLALLWVTGAALMLARAGLQVAGAEQLRRSSRPIADDWIKQLLDEAQRAVGLLRQVRLTVTDRLTSPAVVGVLVPTLILPLSLLTTLTHEQLPFVLLHELAHIRRGDYFANMLQLLIEALLFFNPAVWWISHQVRREREACCDALAIALSDAPVEYARTLVQVAEQSLVPTAAATAFGDEQSEHSALVDRVQRLLVPGYRPALRLTWRATLISFVLGGAVLVVSALGTRNTVGAILADAKAAATPTNTAKTNGASPVGFGGAPRLVEPISVSETVQWTHPRFAPSRRDSGYGYAISDYNSPSLVSSNQTRIPLLDPSASSSRGDWLLALARKNLATNQIQAGELPPLSAPHNRLHQLPSTNRLPAGVRESKDETNELPYRIGTYEVTLDQYAAFLAAVAKSDYYPSLITSNRMQIPLLDENLDPGASSALQTPDWERKIPNKSSTAIEPLPGRLEVVCKLQRIKLKRVVYDNVSLKEVLRDLSEQTVRLDPDGKGVRFVLNPGAGRLIDPATDLPMNYVGAVPEIGRLRIRITPALTDMTLADLLDVLTQVAEPRIRYSVEDFGVVFAANESTEPLYMREFKVDPIKFAQWLNLNLETRGENMGAPCVVVPGNSTSSPLVDQPAGLKVVSNTNSLSGMHSTIKACFALANVDFHPPKHVVYKDRVGLLLVNATRTDLDKIEKLLALINAEPPQVNIKVHLVELDVRRHNLNWYFHNAAAGLTNLPASGSNSFSGILNESQFSSLKRSLENQNGVEFLQMPEVTTSSGRQAQIQSVELRTIVNGLSNSATNGVTNTAFQTTTIPFGPVLDVVPYVAADGVSIQLTLIPTITEFLGYADPKEFTSKLPPEKRPKDQLPLPRMRVRQITTSAIVLDGQTIVLANFPDVITTRHPDGSETKRSNPSKNAKQLIVFITPTIIDPAGNRVHAAR